MSFVQGFFELIKSLPSLITSTLSTFISIFPKCLAAFTCFYEIIGTLIGYLFNGAYWIWSKFFALQLPLARTVIKIERLLEDVKKELNRYILNENTPLILKPVIYFIKKIILIVLELILFIGNALPQILMYLLFLLFWYTVGNPMMMMVEINPALSVATADLFVRATGGVYNFLMYTSNIFLIIYNITIPFAWLTLTGLVYVGQLIYSFVATLLSLNTNISIGSDFNPYSEIAKAGALIGTGGTTNNYVNQNTRLLLEYHQDHLYSHNPVLNIEINNLRRNLALLIDNPVFSKTDPNKIIDFGSSNSKAIQTTIVFIYSFSDIIFSIFYILLDIFLTIATLVANTWKIIFTFIPSGICASANPGCAFREAFVALVNQIIEAIQIEFITGNIHIKGCDESELSDVDCTCALVEGGIYTGLQPCPSSTFECRISINPVTGKQIYSEYKTGGKIPLTSNTDSTLGCPKSYKGNRRLSNTQQSDSHCIETCIYYDNIKSKHHKDGWKFRICGSNKFYINYCNSNNANLNSNDIKRRSLIQTNPIYRQKHIDLYNKSNVDPFLNVKWKDPQIRMMNYKPLYQEDSIKEPPRIAPISMSQLISQINNAPRHLYLGDTYIDKFCPSKINPTIPSSIPDIVHGITCLIRKNSYIPAPQNPQNPQKPQTPQTPKRHLSTSYNITLDPNDWYIGKEKSEMDKEPQVKKNGAMYYYLPPFYDALENLAYNDKHILLQLEEFHDGLVMAHQDYMKDNFPHLHTNTGHQRGKFTKLMLNTTNTFLKHTQEGKDKYKEARSFYRRHLSVDAYNTGSLPNLCGVEGFICPDGTCAPDNDAKKCKPCEDYSLGCTIRSFPIFLLKGVQDIDGRVFTEDLIECWSDILQNPEKNPVEGVLNGDIDIFQSNPINYPPNIRFCPGLLPQLPLFPYFTWSFSKFIIEECGLSDLTGPIVQKCVCPQYKGQADVGDLYSNYIPGVSKAEADRIYNTNIAFLYLFTRSNPTILDRFWQMFISFFQCNPSTCPTLAYAFNKQYNEYGLSASQNLFCIGAHLGSISFALSSFYWPLVIYILYGRRFFFTIASIPGDIIWYIGTCILDYLHKINTTYVVDNYTPIDLEQPTEKEE